MSQEDQNDYPDFRSLNLIFDLTKERIAGQLDQSSTLDNKANFILVSATAVISAALVIQAVLPNAHSPLVINKILQSLPLLLLLIVYLVVMFTAFFAYKVSSFKGVANPGTLYERYLDKPEGTTKAEVFRVMVEAYKHNENIIRKKAIWINCAFVALGCEVVVLVLFLVLGTIN